MAAQKFLGVHWRPKSNFIVPHRIPFFLKEHLILLFSLPLDSVEFPLHVLLSKCIALHAVLYFCYQEV